MSDQKRTELSKKESDLPEGVERTRQGKVFLPNTDIRETEDAIVLVMDMPGVTAESVDVTIENRKLSVRGNVDPSDPEGYEPAYAEYEVGDYLRSFSVSTEIDDNNVEARISSGVLTLTLPKAQPSRQKIEVKAS